MNYSALTIPELKNLARTMNMAGVYSLNKTELIGSIEKEMERREKQEAYIRRRTEEKEAREAEHRLTRQLQFRKQENAGQNAAALDYPFSFLRSAEYNRDYAQQCSQIPGQPQEDIGNFPDNIAEYFWIYEGENDERPWFCFCRLSNDVYVFYKGECDYTGFDCQGDMRIYASKDPNILIEYAMTTSDYELYVAETQVA